MSKDKYVPKPLKEGIEKKGGIHQPPKNPKPNLDLPGQGRRLPNRST